MLLLSVLAACGPTQKQWEVPKERKYYSAASRRLPPPEGYNRLKWVHLPEVLPVTESEAVAATAPQMMPLIHYSVRDLSLEEASRVLAASARYTSYAASNVAGRKVTLNAIGSIEEVAERLAMLSQTRIVVDHENRQLRVLSTDVAAPQFFERSKE